ncbi:lipopolysaccharide biosynthesis protein [Faecalitalea cylindroides]|uniref:lipopolysaccharide biosynthesis protein n=1 Tax=Faecalitalea cylindroides TaxID=39483 RepID=UPI0039947485
MNENLKIKVLSGLFWKFGERVLAQSVSFIVSLVLARLLLPEEYGIVSLVLVFINLANVFVTNGLGESLIQRPNAGQKEFSTMFFCSLFFGIVLYILLFMISPAIETFYSINNLSSVIRVLALQIPISSINTIQQAYVSKNMMFKKFFFSTIGGTIFSGIVGIVMAFCGAGVWALVFQYLVNSIVNTAILFFTISWKPTADFELQTAFSLLSYGWKLVIAQFINQGYVELRSLLIGKVYTTADLASYNKGEQFPSLLVMNINSAISSVLFPAMSTVEGDISKLKEMTRRSIKTSSYVIFPLVTGLMIVAEPLIRILLTDNWISCIPYLQIACIFWMFQPSQTANVQAIKAAGRSDICLKLEVIKKIIGITLLLISVQISPIAVGISNAIFAGISSIINIFPNKKLINYGFIEQFLDIFPTLFLSILMFLLVYQINYLGLNNFATICIEIILGIMVYIIGSVIFRIDSFYMIKNLLERKIKND